MKPPRKKKVLKQFNTYQWGEKDSNLRSDKQQIYSLPHLTTLEPPQKKFVMPSKANLGIRTLDPEITNHVLWPAELSWQMQYACNERLRIYYFYEEMSSDTRKIIRNIFFVDYSLP